MSLSRSKHLRLSRKLRNSRRGGILMLMAALLPVLFIVGSLAINVAYVQLTRTELMVATDAAARAGGRALSHYQNINSAKNAALVTASMNAAGGKLLRLRTEDEYNEIEFGDAEVSGESNRYVFTKIETEDIENGTEVATAMRITGRLSDDSNTGPLSAIFPTFGMKDTFDLQSQAVAMQVDRDISLILDRSGSMAWTDYNWPSGFSPYSSQALNAGVNGGYLYTNDGNYYYTSGNNFYSYADFLWQDHLGLGEPPPSPWEQLVAAVDTFLEVLEGTDQQEQVSLATYASTATLDLELESDYDLVRSTLDSLGPGGATAIGVGMETGIPSLLDLTKARPFAAKTLIVMTDGMHNTGVSPLTAAQDIVADYDVTIHTVTFGSGADQNLMSQVADVGGGQHYHADDAAELIEVFEEIANNLPTIITD